MGLSQSMVLEVKEMFSADFMEQVLPATSLARLALEEKRNRPHASHVPLSELACR